MKNSLENNKNILENNKFLELIDIEVKKFLANASKHYIIEKAKQENCFGSVHSQKDTAGLLGYLRMNFATQIKILHKCNNYYEINSKYCKFLRSDWFKTQVLKNNCISHNLHFKGFDNFNFN